MSQTNMEKIKEFNNKAALKAKTLEDIENERSGEKLETSKTNDQKLKEKAEDKKTPAQIAEEIEQAKIHQEELNRDAMHQLTQATSSIIDRINEPVNSAKNWMSSLPTPGGIAAMLIALFFFALVVIPVNDQGQTRLHLFFQSLLGRTHMKYRENTPVGGSSIHGASGDFGNSGPSSNGVTMLPQNSASNSGPSTPLVDLRYLDIFGLNQ